MMDRIEDETVRYLYFLQVNTGSGPVLPFPEEIEEEAVEEKGSSSRPRSHRQAAKRRWIPHAQYPAQKDRELEQRRVPGGDGTTGGSGVTGAKTGRNDPCPRGSGKKYKMPRSVDGLSFRAGVFDHHRGKESIAGGGHSAPALKIPIASTRRRA
jgi:preprotein translocase subunit SecA